MDNEEKLDAIATQIEKLKAARESGFLEMTCESNTLSLVNSVLKLRDITEAIDLLTAWAKELEA